MIKLNGYPIVAKQTNITMAWSTQTNDEINFEAGTLIFDSVNLIANVGEVSKGRTAVNFDTENPIPWGDSVAQAIKDIFPTPQDAVKFALGEIYESDIHQYKLGTKTPPE